MGHNEAGSSKQNAEPEHTLSYWTAHVSMRILELENRCTGNRTVGSNPTLSAKNSYPQSLAATTLAIRIGLDCVVVASNRDR